MSQVDALIERYGAALSAASALAPTAERELYALHLLELKHLTELLDAEASSDAIALYVSRERRAFGWSFLSGPLGKQVEATFQALAAALEQPCV